MSGVIHMHKAETLVIAAAPFKIIHKAPVEIASYIHAIFHRPAEIPQIPMDKINPVGVVNLAVQRNHIVAGHAVFL